MINIFPAAENKSSVSARQASHWDRSKISGAGAIGISGAVIIPEIEQAAGGSFGTEFLVGRRVFFLSPLIDTSYLPYNRTN